MLVKHTKEISEHCDECRKPKGVVVNIQGVDICRQCLLLASHALVEMKPLEVKTDK